MGAFDEEYNTYYYYKDINGDLDKFLGTWKYQDNDKELIITIHKLLHQPAGGNFHDEIYIKFKYTENGIVIYDTLNDNSVANQRVISGSSIYLENLNLMTLSYREPTDLSFGAGKKYGSLDLEYLLNTSIGTFPQISWKITWYTNRDTDTWPFKIPKSLILTKQP